MVDSLGQGQVPPSTVVSRSNFANWAQVSETRYLSVTVRQLEPLVEAELDVVEVEIVSAMVAGQPAVCAVEVGLDLAFGTVAAAVLSFL